MTTTDIAIRLPLPLGVAGALMQLIGSAWPGSVIVQQEGGLLGGREMVMRIGNEDPVPVDEDAAQAIAESADTAGPVLERFGPDGLSLSNTGELNEVMARACMATFRENPDAANYLEAEVRAPDDDDDDHRYVVIYARSKGQTPHELRQAAEKRLADAEAAIEALLRAGNGGPFDDGLQAALDAIREVKA